MEEESFITPTQDEIKMAFVASCIEDVARELNRPYIEVFERMDKVNMLDNYIHLHYDTLHTESRRNLTHSLIETLNRWENGE